MPQAMFKSRQLLMLAIADILARLSGQNARWRGQKVGALSLGAVVGGGRSEIRGSQLALTAGAGDRHGAGSRKVSGKEVSSWLTERERRLVINKFVVVQGGETCALCANRFCVCQRAGVPAHGRRVLLVHLCGSSPGADGLLTVS